jgi:hypothetical protein
MEIYKSDKQSFKKIVMQMLDVEIKKTTKAMQFYKDNADDCIYVDGAGLIQYEEMADACRMIMDDLQSMMADVEKL